MNELTAPGAMNDPEAGGIKIDYTKLATVETHGEHITIDWDRLKLVKALLEMPQEKRAVVIELLGQDNFDTIVGDSQE